MLQYGFMFGPSSLLHFVRGFSLSPQFFSIVSLLVKSSSIPTYSDWTRSVLLFLEGGIRSSPLVCSFSFGRFWPSTFFLAVPWPELSPRLLPILLLVGRTSPSPLCLGGLQIADAYHLIFSVRFLGLRSAFGNGLERTQRYFTSLKCFLVPFDVDGYHLFSLPRLRSYHPLSQKCSQWFSFVYWILSEILKAHQC